MTSTAYNKKNSFSNTVMAGVFLGAAVIGACPVDTHSTASDSVFFIEQSSRYGALNMDGFQSTMAPLAFTYFKDFIGEDDYEIQPDDFDVFYPDDEV